MTVRLGFTHIRSKEGVFWPTCQNFSLIKYEHLRVCLLTSGYCQQLHKIPDKWPTQHCMSPSRNVTVCVSLSLILTNIKHKKKPEIQCCATVVCIPPYTTGKIKWHLIITLPIILNVKITNSVQYWKFYPVTGNIASYDWRQYDAGMGNTQQWRSNLKVMCYHIQQFHKTDSNMNCEMREGNCLFCCSDFIIVSLRL